MMRTFPLLIDSLLPLPPTLVALSVLREIATQNGGLPREVFTRMNSPMGPIPSMAPHFLACGICLSDTIKIFCCHCEMSFCHMHGILGEPVDGILFSPLSLPSPSPSHLQMHLKTGHPDIFSTVCYCCKGQHVQSLLPSTITIPAVPQGDFRKLRTDTAIPRFLDYLPQIKGDCELCVHDNW